MVAKKILSKKKKSGKKTTQGGAVSPLLQASGPNDAIVPPSYNAGLYTGPPFSGPWGNQPSAPTTTNYINNNLKSANPPPGATISYPGTERLGNNYQAMPGVNAYQSTSQVNWGPHKINCTSGKSMVGGKKKKTARRLKKNNKKKKNNDSLKKKRTLRRRMMRIF